jgi:hypothetical protein
MRTLTIDDLNKIVIALGVTARNATDKQFYEWAEDLVAFEVSESPEQPWHLQERVNLCNYLYKMGEITLQGEVK